jgi:hypothetical protein
MATRFESTVVTCNASVAPSNPTVVALGFDGGIVLAMRIVIPDGHAGLTGIALGYGGNATVPFGALAYYSGNDREIILRYTDNQPGVAWSAFLCNGDTQPHGWEIDFDLSDALTSNAPTLITPVSTSAIIAAGTAAMNGP